MDRIFIVADSTSSMDNERAAKEGIELLSLSVIIDGVEYKDQIDISTGELYEQLKSGAVPSTSQPNTGYIMTKMQDWTEEGYDQIIVLCCSSDLSGTYSGVNLAKEQLEMDNITVIDTRTIGAPILDMAITAKKMAVSGASKDDIVAMVKHKMDHNFSFLYPENFKQLSRSGRLSPLAAGVAGMLKIKVLLALKEDGTQIDKFEMARTESKIMSSIRDHFAKIGVNGINYKIYLAHGNNSPLAKKFEEYLKLHFDNIETEIVELPAVLTSHAGLGSLAIQTIIKN